jgi:hypothetical protein
VSRDFRKAKASTYARGSAKTMQGQSLKTGYKQSLREPAGQQVNEAMTVFRYISRRD